MWNDLSIPPELFETGTITLSSNSVAGNAPIGTVVGVLSLHGKTTGIYRFAIDSNPFFAVSGSNLIVSGSLIVSEQSIIPITISASKGEKTIRQLFLIQEPPLAISTIITSDGQAIGKTIAEFDTTGSAGPFAYTLLSNPFSSFSFSGNKLQVNSVLNVGDIPITIRTTDGVSSTDEDTFVRVLSVAAAWAPGVRPFSITSPANLTIPSDVPYIRLPMPASNGFNYFAALKFYIDVPDSDITTICTWPGRADWGWPAATIHRQMTPGFTGVRFIPGSGQTSDFDNEMISIVGTNCMTSYDFRRATDTTANNANYPNCDILTGTGFGTRSPFLGVGVVAAGSSGMMGILTREEFDRYGGWNHVIALNSITTHCNFSDGPKNGFAPAINNDGTSGDGLWIEGQIAAIKPGTAKPSGLSIYGEAMWITAQNYGFMITDVGGSFNPYIGRFFDPSTGNSAAATSWTAGQFGMLITDMNKIGPLLQRTGYPFDGMNFVMGLVDTWGPQTKLQTWEGGLLMRVTRSTDATILFATPVVGAKNGLLDTTTVASFCAGAGTIGYMTRFYGHHATGDLVSSGANHPIIYQSGAFETINSQPAPLFNGVDNYLKSGNLVQGPAPDSAVFAALIQVPDRAANYAIFGCDAAGGLEIRINASTGFIQIMTNSGTVIATGATAVPLNTPTFIYVQYYVAGSGSFVIRINGVDDVSGTNLVSLVSGNTLVGAGSTTTDFFKGHIGDAAISQFFWGTNTKYIVENYMRDFWGIP